jgi:hypothetical protein
MEQPTIPKEESKFNDQWQSVRFKLAIAILAVYVLFMAYLAIAQIQIEEPFWGRLVFLFSGIEAIVFTAVGFVFGREINRKSEQLASKMVKDAEKEKEKAEEQKKDAESKKEKADREAKINKLKLSKLQEAVITENRVLKSIQGSDSLQFKGQTATDSTIGSRALDLATKYESDESTLIVSFDYEVEAEGFNSLMVDGETKSSKTGYFASVYPYGKTIDVLIDRDNNDTWKFNAKNIMDQDGRSMVIEGYTPKESNSNKLTFQIKYSG